MRKVMLLFGALLFLSPAAPAQEQIVTFAPPSPAASPTPPALNPFTDASWQLAIGYQYNRINLTGTPFNTQGFDVTVVRFLTDSFGLEGHTGFGFGDTTKATSNTCSCVKTVLLTGGVHYAHRTGRLEPWVRGLIGMDHFRFSQSTNAFYGSKSVLAWDGGAGMDYHFNSRTAIRAKVDYLGTRYGGGTERNFQAGFGVVFNF